jgi:PAS domain S-box-containing protein
MWEKITQGQIWQGQVLNRSKSGSTFWVQLTITPVLDEQGQPRKYIGVGFDITSQKEQSIRIKHALEEAATQEAAFRKEIETLKASLSQGGTLPAASATTEAPVPIAALETDLQLTIAQGNAAAQALLAAPLEAQPLAALLANGSELPEATDLLFGIARKGRYSCVLHLRTAEGPQACFAAITPMADADGTLTGLQWWLLPSESAALRQLEAAESPVTEVGTAPEVEALGANMPLPETGATSMAQALPGVPYPLEQLTPARFETDVVGNLLQADDAFCQRYGLAPEAVAGQNLRMLRSQATDTSVFFDMWGTIGRGKVWAGELINRLPDGSDHWVYLRIIPVLNDLQKPVRYQAELYDIQPFADAIPFPQHIRNKSARPHE